MHPAPDLNSVLDKLYFVVCLVEFQSNIPQTILFLRRKKTVIKQEVLLGSVTLSKRMATVGFGVLSCPAVLYNTESPGPRAGAGLQSPSGIRELVFRPSYPVKAIQQTLG